MGEEFLAWIFSLHSSYSGGVRNRLGEMDRAQVEQYFRAVDTNGNGSVDRHEFGAFIKKFSPDAHMSRSEIDELFSIIDKDHSGEIDAPEFLNWVYSSYPSPSAAKRSRSLSLTRLDAGR